MTRQEKWRGMRTAALVALTTAGTSMAADNAWAAGAEAEAKTVAQNSNCKPGKLEVVRQIPGGNGEIVYKVTCSDYPQMFVLVQCRQRLCVLLR